MDVRTADWLANRLREAGRRVEFQEFTVPLFQGESVSLSVAGAKIAAFPQWPARATDGTIVGRLAAIDAVSVKGCAVLLEDAPLTWREDAAQVKKHADAGAVVVLRVARSDHGEIHVANVPRPDTEPYSIPCWLLAAGTAAPCDKLPRAAASADRDWRYASD